MPKRNPTPPAEDQTDETKTSSAKEKAPEAKAPEKVDPKPPADLGPDDRKTATEMEEAAELAGNEAETHASIRDLTRLLSNRIGAVMASTGKRPGNLVAMQAELNTMTANDHPLMDYAD